MPTVSLSTIMLRSEKNTSLIVIGLGLAVLVGGVCAVLVALGNPGNMGVCGVCFLRDVAGALRMHGNGGVQVFRPEVVGIVLGALVWRLAGRRYEARSGSHATTRLFFGIWMAIGALVFLGCPFRMLQRIGGGDLNALVALPGFLAGVGAGLWMEKRGYSAGKTSVVAWPVGLIGPAAAVVLLVLFLTGSALAGPGPGDATGPAHAVWYWALGLALAAGVALSATGFCAVAAGRQVFQGPRRMLLGAVLLIVGYGIVSLATGNWKLGFEGQPAAHADWLWNILAMALVGLTGVLAGGCPVRQIVLAGEGNGDGFVTVIGLLIGGALAHNLGLASTGAGATAAGQWAVILGLTLSVAYGLAMLTKRERGTTTA